MKTQLVRNLKAGDSVNSTFAIKFKKPPKNYRSVSKEGAWFELRLGDKSGEISAKYWGEDEKETVQLYQSVDKGDIVLVNGKVTVYHDIMEITMDKNGLMRCTPDEFNLTDFVEVTDHDIDKMMAEVADIINGIEEPYCQILNAFFNDSSFVEQFKKAPAAMHRHQNYIGGLLEHTLNVARLCQRIHELHQTLDYDLLMTGALLHDIGKIHEFAVTTAIDISEMGMLLGHITIGAQMLNDRLRTLDVPDRIQLKLTHIILSHHGKQEYGSPKTPQFPEAYAVYFADDTDAKVDHTLTIKRDAETDDPWVWRRDMGHIYLK
jgi:3'-5' exoribonuclease